MGESKNDSTKIEVPVLCFDEYQKMIEERKPLPRNFKSGKRIRKDILQVFYLMIKSCNNNFH